MLFLINFITSVINQNLSHLFFTMIIIKLSSHVKTLIVRYLCALLLGGGGGEEGDGERWLKPKIWLSPIVPCSSLVFTLILRLNFNTLAIHQTCQIIVQISEKCKLQVDQTVVKTGSTLTFSVRSARTIVTMCMENADPSRCVNTTEY